MSDKLSPGDNLYEISKFFFSGKYDKYFEMSSAIFFLPIMLNVKQNF